MKKLSLSILMLGAVFTSGATTFTVNNSLANPGQHSNIQSAVNAATNGDTILIHGSTAAYSGFNLSKRLIFVGPGLSPDKDLAIASVINSRVNLNGGCDGSEFWGLIFTSDMLCNAAISNIRVSRCHFGSPNQNIFPNGNNVTNWVVQENQFIGEYSNPGPGSSGMLFQNNMFRDNECCAPIMNSVEGGHLFVNNVFYGNSNASNWGSFNTQNGIVNVSNCSFSNNIFQEIEFTSVSNNSFLNNITFSCANNNIFSSGNVDAGDNIVNTSPQFVNQTAINSTTFNASGEFLRLDAGSPCLSSGGLDAEMGVYGGSGNYANVTSPPFPNVKRMNVLNTSVAAGGNLQVNIIATKKN